MSVVINYWAVLGAVVAAMVIGSAWYSPLMFLKMWLKELGSRRDEQKGSPAKAMTGMAVAALVEAYILAHFAAYAGAHDLMTGLTLGFWVWLGFVAPTLATMSLFEGRSWKLFWISASNQLVTYLVMGAILAIWR